MTRAQEWADLLALEPPARLGDTVERALRRREEERERTRRRRVTLGRWLAPACTLAGAVCAFTLVVNLSVPFALACGRLPLLKAAVKVVAFDPGLKTALESDYYQILEGTYTTEEGVTFKPYCLMASEQRVSLLCSFDRGVAHPTLTDGAGEKLAYAALHPESGDMVLSNFDLSGDELPEELVFTYAFANDSRVGEPVGSRNGESLGEITFAVRVDERFRREKRVVELGVPFTLDGQRLRAERLELTPVSSLLVLSAGEDNTAWLKDMSFYLEDEKGRQYTWTGTMGKGSGNHAYPRDGGDFVNCYRFSGLYDVDPAHLTLHIAGAKWLTKDRPRPVLHLDTGEAEHLPDYVLDWWWEDGTGAESVRHGVEAGTEKCRGLHLYTRTDIPSATMISVLEEGLVNRSYGVEMDDSAGFRHIIVGVEGTPGETITLEVWCDSYTYGQDVAVELY